MRNLWYGKSGCCWRVGGLQRSNRASRACENTGIPRELLILLPMAVRALPARPVCCHPMSASSSGGDHRRHPQVPAKGLAGSRKKERAVWPEQGLQGDVGATCACRKRGGKTLHVAQLFL